MALIALPPELLEQVVICAIPESFEALALSCKPLLRICIPFVARHNQLSRQYTNFVYHDTLTAFDLIARIATEPIVARYIRDADFGRDSHRFMDRRCRNPEFADEIEDVKYGGTVARLLADSPYLEQAGIDWEAYWVEMKRELMDNGKRTYSQHAAAFLLTLLPNVESVYLPRSWQPSQTSNRLLDAITRTARESYVSSERLGLASTTTLHGESKQANLGWAHSIIALPRLRYVVVYGSVDVGSLISHPESFGHRLSEVTLCQCDIDSIGITSFLRRTPYLRRLTYSHNTGGRVVGSYYHTPPREPHGPRDWDVCEFISAIGREVGGHLEELSISIKELYGSITPGKVSMQEFRRLRHLRIPFELAQCHIDAASQLEDWEHNEWHVTNIVTGDLVPTTVQVLSMPSPRGKSEQDALESIVRGLRRGGGSETASALQSIYVCSHGGPCMIAPDDERVLRTEAEKAGVALHVGLHESSSLARALDRSNAAAALVERPSETVVYKDTWMGNATVDVDTVSSLPLR